MDLTILLPALNEVEAIGPLLDEIQRDVKVPHTVLVIDSDSTDGTDSIALNHKAVLMRVRKEGKGAAVRSGLHMVGTPYVIMMNSDYTYPAGYVNWMYDRLKNSRADVVIGHRDIVDKGAMAFVNSVGNWLLSLEASILYNTRVYDVCSGMWGFRTEVLKQFRLTSKGFTLEADLFVNTVKSRRQLQQIPIAYRARLGGSRPKLQVRDGLKIGWFLLKRRFS